MPAPIYYSAFKILHSLAEARHSGAAPTFLEPDAKSQVTPRLSKTSKPVRATSIVVSTQHAPGYGEKGENADPANYKVLHDYVMTARFAERILPEGWMCTDETRILRQSHRPASSSADPTATPGSLDARSSSTPMAALRRMAAAPFQRQGPDQGRSFGRLCRALPREKRHRGRSRAIACTIQV